MKPYYGTSSFSKFPSLNLNSTNRKASSKIRNSNPVAKDTRKRHVQRLHELSKSISLSCCCSLTAPPSFSIATQILMKDGFQQLQQQQHTRFYHKSIQQHLASEVYIPGHGPQIDVQSKSTTEKLPPISPEQRKAADLELERMKLSTEHIITTFSDQNSRSNISSAFVNEVRVTFNYWISRWNLHYHPYLTPSPTNVLPILKPRSSSQSEAKTETLDDSLYSDYGTNQALKILKCLLQTNDHELVKQVLFKSENASFINLIESMLLPCTTNFTRKPNDMSSTIENTNADFDGMQLEGQGHKNLDLTGDNHVHFSSNTGFHNVQPSIWKSCIIKALYIMDVMNDLQSRCNIDPNVDTYNARLLVWTKLATLLQILKYQEESGGLNKNTKTIKWGDTHASTEKSVINELNIDERDIGLSPLLAESLQMESVNDVVKAMEEILTIMEQEIDNSVKPSIESYNYVISAISRSDASEAPYHAELYLKRMEMTEDISMNVHVFDEDKTERTTSAFADTATYNLVLNAFASSTSLNKNGIIDNTRKKRASDADRILTRMEERYDRIRRDDLRPDVLSYSTVLNCYANAGMAVEAERILNKMITISDNDNDIRPNVICFNTVIDAWAKTRGLTSPDKAYDILGKMENLAESDDQLYPDTISYTSVISAFARSGNDDAGDRAEELLQRSIDLYKNEGRARLKPDSITFITVLDALSKQALRVFKKRRNITECNNIEERMISILKQMDDLDVNVRPCTVSHNIFLDFYAKSLQPNKAESHLKEHMVENYQNGNQNVKPDIVSYNSVLLALSRSPHKGSLQKAEQLLKSMEDDFLPHGIVVKPDLISYNTVMSGFRRNINSSSIERVNDLLLHMEERSRNGLSIIKPNNITYNIVLDAWGKSQHPDTINHIKSLLQKMIESEDIQPDVFSFSSVISTLASSGKKDAPEQAQHLIQQMKDLNIQPNRITYNSLINCWSKSGRQGAAEKAEEVLIQMTEMEDPESSPDAITFSSVINCWAQSGEYGCGERAQAILDMMEDNWKAGNDHMKPNRYTYGSVLNAFAKDRNEHSLEKALELLERMKNSWLEGNDEARPTEAAYNTGN